MKEETRKEIRQKMADYRQPAPEVSWDVLEKALAGNKPARKVALWPKRVAAAAAVLLLAGLGWQALKLADKSLDEEGTELVQNPTGEVTDGQNKSPDQYADGSLEKEQQATSEKFMERSASQLVAGIPVHNTEELPVTVGQRLLRLFRIIIIVHVKLCHMDLQSGCSEHLKCSLINFRIGMIHQKM